MTTCKFYLRDSKLTTISGADAGSYMINDNQATIKISTVEKKIKPFDMTKTKIDTGQVYTIEVS